MFEGLAINRSGLNGTPERFSYVRFAAAIGNKRLPARHLVYGQPRGGSLQVIVCAWRIPADAAGKTLRLWKNRFAPGWPGAVVRTDFRLERSRQYRWRIISPSSG